MEGMLQMATAQ